jgi:predicted nucleic acid-binding protein
MEDSGLGQRLKQNLRGKSVQIALCDVVLREVKRVRGYTKDSIVARISKLLGRKIEILETSIEEKSDAEKISKNYLECHNGDNLILALCRLRDIILITFDRALLRVCHFIGVIAFNPLQAGGI